MTPLVGRQDVLAYLGGVLSQGRTGAGGLVLVTGEPGIGKTRVAEELARRAEGFSVHWAWCTSERTTASLRPWSLIVRTLVGRNTEVAARVQESPHLQALLAGNSLQQGDPELSRALLANDLSAVLELAARTTPLLLVLDDVHDAQLSTLRVLAGLADVVRTCPVVIVATARDGAHEWRGREQVRGELLGQAHRLSLGPLTAADVAALLSDPTPEQVQSLLARTGGNALLVTELAGATDEVSASLRAMVATRCARLPPASRHLVEVGAVLGPRFRLDVLAEVADVPAEQIAGQLGDLVVADGPGRACFRHELLRDAIYAELPPAQLQHWHARAGEVLAGLHRRGSDVDAAEVATHLLHSGADGAAEAAVEAARRAAGMSAFEDAVRWYGEALPLLSDPPERVKILLEMARAQRGSGDRVGARALLLQAAALAPTPEQHAEAALALGTGPGGFEVDASDSAQIAQLEKALAALPDSALALRAAVLARLSVARYAVTPAAESLAQAEEAVVLARASGDRVVLAGALAALCDATAGPGHLDQRLAHAREIVSLASDAPEVELLGRRLRVQALLERGDRSRAELEVAAYAMKADAVRHPLYRWYVPLWRGFWALAEGRYEDCAAATAEAQRLGAGSENAVMLTITQTWWRLAQQGDRTGLTELFCRNDITQFTGAWAVLALALSQLQQGLPELAYATFGTVAHAVLDLPRDSEWLPSMAQVCQLLEAGEHPLRQPVYRALLPFADQFVIEGIGAAARGPVSRFLAMVAPDAATARQHQQASDSACRAFGATALLAAAPATQRPSWLLEGDTWAVSFGGPVHRVRDSKGMRDLAALLAAQGRAVGALDLAGAEGVLQHDTGEVLDAQARHAYKERLRELETSASLSEAEAHERELLLDQLAGAYGLGGRARRQGSSAERARSAVTARVREAIKRLEDLDPVLGKHLRHAVRTGTFCSYQPEAPVPWDVTP